MQPRIPHLRLTIGILRFLSVTLFAVALACVTGNVTHGQTTYAHFEARQVHPIALSPDGNRLFALNSTDGRLSVFDVSHPFNATPLLLVEIPVGLEPVSVRARTNDEVWVVSEVSDHVAVVSISRGTVIETLKVPDEPADVVFANGKAFVTCARSNLVRVFDTATRTELTTIPLQGLYPRALAVNADGSRVYVAFLHSGNRTTVLPASVAPAQPAPTNPNLPAPPDTALIVPASDSRISYTVLDNDVAEINTTTHAVTRYFTDAGTNLFDIAVQPSTGDLWVTNTDARNLVRFEPVLRGHFVDNRLTRITTGGVRTIFDLNPGIDYAVLPNAAARETALAQPTAAVFSPLGTHMWVAVFGTDRVAKIGSDGVVQERVDVRTTPPGGAENSSRYMRGPRGLALHAGRARLYVLNKLSNSISVINANTAMVITEVPAGSYDPMPAAIKEGRGFLFDARLSGNGTMSCASCHLDADLDGIAWDLGDPGGEMMTVMGANLAAHDTTPRERVIHPMKGPLTTQTLRGMQAGAPFHWRGDRPTLQSFNPTFDKLMGGEQIPQVDIDAMAAYLLTLRHHPNPNRKLDNTLPPSLAGGNPNTGRTLFNDHVRSHCAVCHEGATGSNNNLDDARLTDSRDQAKTPPLRTVYQRIFFNRLAGSQNLSGFGLNRDGTGSSHALPTAHFYDLDQIEGDDFAHVKAFVLCFDTGTPPVLGLTRTVTAANSTNSTVLSDVSTLESQARAIQSDLVVQGRVGGELRSFFYNRSTQRYRTDRAGEEALTRNQLLALLGPDDAITFSSTLVGQGQRRGGDRDANGTFDANEPQPTLTLAPVPAGVRASWPASAPGWTLQSRATLEQPWETLTQAPQQSAGFFFYDFDPLISPSGFFRLRRTW